MIKKLISSACVLAFFSGGALEASAQQLEDCYATPTVYSGTTLANLADRYFADVDYRYAILLATNARTSDGFPFIGNPHQLPLGKQLCVPAITEAERLRNRFLMYIEAVQDMALPVPSEVTNNLSPLDVSGPVGVATWVRADQAASYRAQVGQTIQAGGDIWVTEVPKIQEFCKSYAQTHGDYLPGITLRLEQRLGMPPHSAKTAFVEFEVANPDKQSQIFRPCASPSVTTSTCAMGPPASCDPGDAQCHRHYDFFMGQYYYSYGVSLPAEYPWTSLGYTFDWAHKAIGLEDTPDFVQYGGSEYVVPKGATVTVRAVYDTADYCKN